MAKYNKEDKVSLKSNPNIKVIISDLLEELDGEMTYEVQYPTGEIEVLYESDLTEFLIVKDAWDFFAENKLDSYFDFSIANTVSKINNVSNNTISTFKASRVKFLEYQYKPLIKFLRSVNRRLLIADEVGLGKTIEAGNIMLELLARGELNNVLIVCSKSLLEKWRREMEGKFYLDFEIYESRKDLENKIRRFINRDEPIKAIVNYEKLQIDNTHFLLEEKDIEELAEFDVELEQLVEIQDKEFLLQPDFEKVVKKVIGTNSFYEEVIKKAKKRNDKIEKNEILKLIQESEKNFDFVICDEAHRLRNKTLAHKGIKKILDNANAAVFLTATPIMIKLENLYNLLNLLEEKEFDEYEKFEISINNNKPFVKAITLLRNDKVVLQEIAKYLENETIKREYYYSEKVSEYFKDNYFYKEAIKLLNSGTDTVAIRARVIDFLTELNAINHIYTRTRKRDVEKIRVKRVPIPLNVKFTDDELLLYNSVIEEYDYSKSILGLIMKKRQITSCIPAYETDENDLLQSNYPKKTDSKFDKLVSEVINNVVLKEKKKIIVFSYFRKTLLYLNARLQTEFGISTEIIYGGMKDRDQRINNFQNNDNVKILLSSEVGSEGIDLQFCDTIVNYDLPWNPMVVEQRIGRIDRVGQDKTEISIYTLVIEDTIEKIIFERLLDRINIFREALGDLEEILTDDQNIINFDKLEQELYGNKDLTEEERNSKIDSVAFALEQQRIMLEQIKEEQTNAISIDYAFDNIIEDVKINSKYPTEIELIKYIESIFRTELSVCKLKRINDNLYHIELPNNQNEVLFQFIENNLDLAKMPDIRQIYRDFKLKNADNTIIKVTFNQEYAFNNQKIDFINPLHPFIKAITNFYISVEKDKNLAFRIAVKKSDISNEYNVPVGDYTLVVFGINIQKHEPFGKRVSDTTHIKPLMIEFSGDKPVLIDERTTEYVFGLAQTKTHEPTTSYQFNAQFAQDFKKLAGLEILKQRRRIEQEENEKYSSKIDMIMKKEELYYNNLIKRKQNLLDEGKGIKEILSKEIETLGFNKQKRLNELKKLKQNTVNYSNRIISVNYLQIIE